MKIFYTPTFERKFKAFEDKEKVKERTEIFLNDPFDKKLDTHKLKGRLKRFYSFSIDRFNRIIFTFSKDKKSAHFHSIGNHDIYK